MHLQREILSSAECPTDPGEHEANLVLGETETGSDLVEILVHCLSGNMQFDSRATWVRQCECSLKSEERLVLHPHLVRTLDHHGTGGAAITAQHPLVPDDVAVGVNRRMTTVYRPFGVGERLE